MSARLRVGVALSLAVALAAPAVCAYASGAATPKRIAKAEAKKPAKKATKAKKANKRAPQVDLVVGRKVYKQYCGKCHALKAARAAGFGGPTTEPGPSFNDVRVTWRRSINAIVQTIAGHETLAQKMTWKQINDVSRYVAVMTRRNPLAGSTAYG